jgi:hypothetical protein
VKLIEFEAQIVEVGEGGVTLMHQEHQENLFRVVAGLAQERECGARLYQRVRVTVEALEP